MRRENQIVEGNRKRGRLRKRERERERERMSEWKRKRRKEIPFEWARACCCGWRKMIRPQQTPRWTVECWSLIVASAAPHWHRCVRTCRTVDRNRETFSDHYLFIYFSIYSFVYTVKKQFIIINCLRLLKKSQLSVVDIILTMFRFSTTVDFSSTMADFLLSKPANNLLGLKKLLW